MGALIIIIKWYKLVNIVLFANGIVNTRQNLTSVLFLK